LKKSCGRKILTYQRLINCFLRKNDLPKCDLAVAKQQGRVIN
jgi:hypothetical protein